MHAQMMQSWFSRANAPLQDWALALQGGVREQCIYTVPINCHSRRMLTLISSMLYSHDLQWLCSRICTEEEGLPSSCQESGIGGLLEGLEALVRLIHFDDIHLLANAGLHHVNVQQVELVQLLD